jgi:hypothetical protein
MAPISTAVQLSAQRAMSHRCTSRPPGAAARICARLLLDRGADTTITDPEHDSTPRGWARHFNNGEIAEMIARA